MSIRYLAQRFGSNTWLDYELPLVTDGPEFAASSYGVIDGTIAPEVGRRLADDGRRLLEPWGTWIHAETSDERLWTGVVESVQAEGARLRVKIREWHGYLHGLTFTGRIWGVKADPANLVRDLWAHVQSFPTGALGVTVTGTTPVKVGTDLEDKAIGARYLRNLAKQEWDAKSAPRKAKQTEIKKKSAPFDKQIKQLNKEKRPLTQAYQAVVTQQKPTRDAYTALTKERTRRRAVYDALVKAKAPAGEITAAKAAVEAMADPIATAKAAVQALNPARDAAKAPLDAKNAQIAAVRAAKELAVGPLTDQLDALVEAEELFKVAHEKAEEALRTAEEALRDGGGAYKVLSKDRPDCWRVLTDLAAATPFDFVTRTERTHGAPKLTLEIKYPAAGRTRSDLVFERGRNIIGVPTVLIPNDYASEVIAVGAGEGESIEGWDLNLEVTVTETDPRMRRTAVYSDPSITDKRVLTSVGRADLRRLRATLHVPELLVRDDPNCPIGAWSAGDIITIRLGTVPHFGPVEVRHRIRSWQRVGTHRARLGLETL
ncbi:hypothetical protein [Leucobacter sp.]